MDSSPNPTPISQTVPRGQTGGGERAGTPSDSAEQPDEDQLRDVEAERADLTKSYLSVGREINHMRRELKEFKEENRRCLHEDTIAQTVRHKEERLEASEKLYADIAAEIKQLQLRRRELQASRTRSASQSAGSSGSRNSSVGGSSRRG